MINRNTNLILSSIIATAYFIFNLYLQEKEIQEIGGNSSISWISISTTVGFFLIGFTSFVFILRKQKVIQSNGYFLFLFALLLASYFPLVDINWTTLLALLLCIWSIPFVIQIHNQNSIRNLLFYASILCGIAGILFFPTFTYLLFILIGISVFRPFNPREFLLIISCFCMPLLYYLSWNFLNDNPSELNFEFAFIDLNKIIFTDLSENKWGALVLISAILLAIFAIVTTFLNRTKRIVRQRNQIVVLFVFLLISVLNLILYGDISFVIPISLLLALFLQLAYQDLRRKWLVNILMFILYLVSILINFGII